MAAIIYTLCAFTALLCAVLLLQTYRRSRYTFLLWSGLCFVGLTVNNALVVVDELLIQDIDFSIARLVVGLLAMLVLVYGLIWKVE
jgi:phosphatidylserine synthase